MEYQLTANVIYNLLLEHRIKKHMPGDNYKRKNKFTQTHLFYDLMMLTDNYKKTIGEYNNLYNKYINKNSVGKPKTCTLDKTTKNLASKFKKGEVKLQYSDIYILANEDCRKAFSTAMDDKYDILLHKTQELTNRYFPNNKSDNALTFIKEIIYYIIKDDKISNNEEFTISTNPHKSVTKSDLRNTAKVALEIEFETFLLSIWHFTIKEDKLQTRINENTPFHHKDTDSIHVTVKQLPCSTAVDIITPKFSKKIRNKPNKITHSELNDDIETPSEDEMIEAFYPIEMDYNTNFISLLNENHFVFSRTIFFHILCSNLQPYQSSTKFSPEQLFLDLIQLTFNVKYHLNDSIQPLEKHFYDFKNKYKADVLDDDSRIKEFDDRLKADYYKCLYKINEVQEKYFNSEQKNESLIIEILEFIKNDSSIPDNFPFYVCADGSCLTKSQLLDSWQIEFAPFLLGMWHYVISLTSSKDDDEQTTFKKLFELKYCLNDENYVKCRSSNVISKQSKMVIKAVYTNFL